MTDPKTTTTAPSEPAPLSEQDLEAQLEALLAEIEAREPGVVVGPSKAGTSPSAAAQSPTAPEVSPRPTLRLRTAAPPASTAKPPTPEPVVEKTTSSPPAPTAPPPPPPAPTTIEAPAVATAPQVEESGAHSEPTAIQADNPLDAPAASSAEPTGNDLLEQQLAEILAEAQAAVVASKAAPPAAQHHPPQPEMSSAAATAPAPVDNVMAEAVSESPASATDDPTAEIDVAVAEPEPEEGLASGPTAAATDAPESQPASRVKASLSEDDLAAQLQALLDSATPKIPPAFATPATPEATESSAATSAAAPPTEAPAEAPAAPPAPAAGSAPVSIAEIDQLLAENADNAVAGAFDTVNDVASPEAPLATAAASPGTAPPSSDGQTPASPPLAVPADAEDVRQDTEPLAGAFETPEDIIEPSPAAPAVAAETAEQEEAVEAPPATDDGPSPFAGSRRRSDFADIVYRTLAVLNSPLRFFTPEIRNTIGYVAILTVFNAVCLIAYGLLSGGDADTPQVATTETASYDEPASSASGGSH